MEREFGEENTATFQNLYFIYDILTYRIPDDGSLSDKSFDDVMEVLADFPDSYRKLTYQRQPTSAEEKAQALIALTQLLD